MDANFIVWSRGIGCWMRITSHSTDARGIHLRNILRGFRSSCWKEYIRKIQFLNYFLIFLVPKSTLITGVGKKRSRWLKCEEFEVPIWFQVLDLTPSPFYHQSPHFTKKWRSQNITDYPRRWTRWQRRTKRSNIKGHRWHLSVLKARTCFTRLSSIVWFETMQPTKRCDASQFCFVIPLRNTASQFQNFCLTRMLSQFVDPIVWYCQNNL